jgi:hypothetical protein
MTDPNDDLSSIADPGSMDPATMGEPEAGADHEQDDQAGVPGEAADSPAAQGSPVGPPD